MEKEYFRYCIWTTQLHVSKTWYQTIPRVHTSKELAISGAQGAKAQTWQDPWCNTKAEWQICRSLICQNWKKPGHPGPLLSKLVLRRRCLSRQGELLRGTGSCSRGIGSYTSCSLPACSASLLLSPGPLWAQPRGHTGKVNLRPPPDPRWFCGCISTVF